MRKLLFLLALASPAAALQSEVNSGRSDDRAQPGTLTVEEIRASLAEPGALEPMALGSRFGLGDDLSSFVPASNPLTPAKVELGRQLYFDKRLSKDGTVSCATCHDPAMGWTDNAPVSTGIAGQKGGRSAPTVVNRLFGKTQFWDGRAASLEEQSLGPIGNPVEMGFSPEEAAARLAKIEGYRIQFQAVFDSAPTPETIARAVASFERTILTSANKNDYYEQAFPFFDYEPEEGDTPEFLARLDRALDLEREHRMSASAERGRDLFFGKAKCSACHSGPDFSDELFHNLGVGMDVKEPDLGRFLATENEDDKGAFKTPSLRNIAFTAPYMHDGSQATLMDVVLHYDKGGTKNPWLSEKIFPLELTESERQDLVRFLEEALAGPVTDVEVPRLP